MSDFDAIRPGHPWYRQYAGQWVAISRGKVVAHSSAVVDIHRALKAAKIRGAVIQKVGLRPTR